MEWCPGSAPRELPSRNGRSDGFFTIRAVDYAIRCRISGSVLAESHSLLVRSVDAQQLGDVLWRFLRIGASPTHSDAIVVFGGNDLRVATWAAQLTLDGWAQLLICSGGSGNYTRTWTKPEAHIFRRIAIDAGVDERAILMEDQSTNSGENVTFTRRLLAEHEISVRRVICVHKPYMERRAWATLRKWWPNCVFVMSSPPIPYDEYPHPNVISADGLLDTMVGQVDRIQKYPSRGFIIPVVVPELVAQAKAQLVELGFTYHLIGT